MEPVGFGKPTTTDNGCSEKVVQAITYKCPVCGTTKDRLHNEGEASFKELHVKRPPKTKALGGRRI